MTAVPPVRTGRVLALLVGTIISIAVSALLGPGQLSSAYEPWWVQTHTDAQFWSGPDDKAVEFGPVSKGTLLLVIAPQDGQRLRVQEPRSGNVAFVDASAVGPASPPRLSPVVVATPSGPQGITRTPPKAAAGFTPFWVSNFEETDLWSGTERWSPSLGAVPQFRRFLVVEPRTGQRFKVWYPEADSLGYLDESNVGPVGPSAWLQPHPLKSMKKVQLPGRSVGETTYLRNLPLVADETELRRLPSNSPVTVIDSGIAPDGTEWYMVGDGMYVRASEMRLPTPPGEYKEGKWIDADLTEPTMVTAYEGDKIAYTALAIRGKDATPTLAGEFSILRRVDNETMDSSTLGIPRESPDGYYLKDVLYTQYFTPQGAALHYNYWLGTFGTPGSHGCLGLNLEDSTWFWDWAEVGTPVVVRQ